VRVVPIHLPSLKQRREDIPLLVDYFLRQFSKKNKKTIQGISPEALELLMEYDWPGNVRELKHLIERIVILEDEPILKPENIPWFIHRKQQDLPLSEEKVATLQELEKEYIGQVLTKTQGNRTQAAGLLGINRKTLLEKIKKYRL